MTVPRSTFGSRGIAAYRYHTLAAHLGADHPATRAALGRLLYHRGAVPQIGLRTAEAVAWMRESGAIRGYMNRTERARSVRFLKAPTGARGLSSHARGSP